MNDPFSQLAKKIRQEKINKKEIQKIKKEIIDQKVLNIIKTDMAIRIQKVFRSFLYRKKKYYDFLEEKNTETIINYLYEKRLNRIHTNSKMVISNHVLNYINNILEEKEKKNKQKINSIDLIKAVLRGMIFRKKFNKKKYSSKDFQNIIEKHILGYKIKLILRSNNIQSLLIDIANIRASLDNIDESNEANSQKIKELKTKLTKNINLFYFTFYQMKENSNWISQSKIQEPWIKKYMLIIYKDKYKDVYDNLKNNTKAKSIYSNQKKIRRLKENNGNNKNNETKKDALRNADFYNSKNNTISYDRENSILNSNMGKEALNTEDNLYNNKKDKENKENKDNNSVNSNGENDLAKSGKGYDFNFYDSESDELDELSDNRNILHKGTDKFSNTIKNKHENVPKIKRIKSKQYDKNQYNEENNNEDLNIKNRSNIKNKYKSKKSQNELNYSNNESSQNKEENNLDDKEINNFNEEENNIRNEEMEKEKIEEPKKLNKYQLREERPIKPLTNNNFLENENPFGLKRDSKGNLPDMNRNQNKSNTKKSIEKRAINTTRASNRSNIQKGYKELSETEKEEDIKTQEKTDLSHEETPITNKYIEYDNRPCGGGAKNSAFYDFSKYDDSKPPEKLDRNERPLAGGKKIDYNAMFGNGSEEFEGDPFGGAKQFETNKDKVKNIHKTNTVKKKPVYDARKAIEEAKSKEAKEGKKEKPSAFREFLREMKKISAEEKAQHNETISDNKKNDKNNKNKNIKKNDKKDNLDTNSNTESNISKLETEEKIPKKSNKKQDKKLNLKKENEEKNELTNSSNNIMNLDEKDKENSLKKRHRGSVILKGTETKEIDLRRKLHELEKAPAPVLNIKGIKSRIECWNGSNDNKKNKMNSNTRETPKSKDEKKSKINKQNDEKIISNFINNKKLNELSLSKANNSSNINANNTNLSSNSIPRIKKMEEKIEKYVEKKLMQLHLQVEEIDELFNLEKYFDEKEDKMKQYTSLPYIKENFSFVTKYSIKDYDEKIGKIEKKYKELK